MYTATCYLILKPVLQLLRQKGIEVSITTLLEVNKQNFEELLAEDYYVYNDLDFLNKYLSKEYNKPRLLLLVADFDHPYHNFGYDAVKKARENGIPSLSVQHGAMILDESGTNIHLYSTFTSDKQALWGKWYYDALVSMSGIDPNRLVVTGNPQFDSFVEIDSVKSRNKVCSYWKIEKDKNICTLTFALQVYRSGSEPPSEEQTEKVMNLLVPIMKAVKDANAELIIRPHPAEYVWGLPGWYEEAARRAGQDFHFNDPRSLEEPSLAEILSASDVTITQWSSTGLQSVLLGTPVISVQQSDLGYSGTSMKMYFDGYTYRQVYGSSEDIEKNLKNQLIDLLTEKPDQQRFSKYIEKFADKIDGLASERVCNVIEDMVQGQFRKAKDG
jgi:CDP-glycerol glycerophosphotransferase (TagB/SpsB family)